MKYFIAFVAALFVVPALAQQQPAPPTLIQQLQSYLAYQLGELDEYGPPPGCLPNNCYAYYSSQRLAKQLTAAQAAAAAGNPLPPIRTENGSVAPSYP